MSEFRKILSSLHTEIELASNSVYQLDQPTPLEVLELPEGRQVWLKREDQSAIHSYKWRGAYHKMSRLLESGDHGPFVTTSAGNHAQGVAASARKLNARVTIFMPKSTPRLKRRSVKRHGGGQVEIVLVGDTFDEAQAHAREFAERENATPLHPFDDVQVVAGQATVGLEILDQLPAGPRYPKIVYVPVGGGGLASGLAAALKLNRPEFKVIGVEVDGQDSMKQSVDAQRRIALPKVDTFCDGTAVACPGDLTFQFCRRLLDELITVSNDEVCRAIQFAWEEKRLITEPSGSIALAGFLKHAAKEDSAVVVVSGSNTDFLTLPTIARKSRLSQPARRYFQFEIAEQEGSLIELLDQLMEGINIVDFQYGKTADDHAHPVLGLLATEEEFRCLDSRLNRSRVSALEVTGDELVRYRVIAFQPERTNSARFLRVDFPDRPGALRDLMRRVEKLTNICYFNFQESGESEGHALIGFEFANNQCEDRFFKVMSELNFKYHFVDSQRLFGNPSMSLGSSS